MSNQKPNLDSLFEAAVEIDTAEERAAFLQTACGDDLELRRQLERLLQSSEQAGSFLDKPPITLDDTILTECSDCNLVAAFDAGLSPAFTVQHDVGQGGVGDSVLKILCRKLDRIPRVSLLEPTSKDAEPMVRPRSAEMPQNSSDCRYQLQGEIARGGMGAILKGRDTDLGRDLAIKVLLDQYKEKPEVILRFVEEAQIGGQLQHPGIAPVYELGQFADMRPFFAMKLVKGETLSKLLADRQDPTSDRGRFIGIFEQICQTMAYAHSRGVIHRDLKPANIMVGAFGEVQVMDWGLAKVLQVGGIADEKMAMSQQQDTSSIQTRRNAAGSDPTGQAGRFETFGSHTQMGSVMGTPAYMPPEQALGEIDHLDERADVFGLGAILCEILTGKPPYVGDNGTIVFRMASRGKVEDAFARLDACGADAELITLTKQCLKVEPKDRPRNANALAEKITEHLASVESRLRATELDRASQAARADEALRTAKEHEAAARHERRARKLQMGLAAIVLCVLTLGGIAATWTAAVQSRLKNDAVRAEQSANSARERAVTEQARAEREKTRAEFAQRQADEEKSRSLNMLADMQTERGLQSAREGQSATAALWFANAAALTPHDPGRQTANYVRAASWMSESLVPKALLKLPDGSVRRFQFQPNGPLLLTVSGTTLRVWDWRKETELPWYELRDVTDAVWSPDGARLAVGFGTSDIGIIDTLSGDELKRLPLSAGSQIIEWSPDGKRLAAGNQHVTIWNVQGEPAQESDWPHPKSVFGLRFNRAGTRLVTSCEDNFARVFAVEDASLDAPLHEPVEHLWESSFPVRCTGSGSAVFLDDRIYATVSGNSRQALLRDATTGQLVTSGWSVRNRSAILGIVVSPDGRWVAAADGQTAVLWGPDGRSLELKHSNFVIGISFANNCKAVVTTCWDGIARRWPLNEDPDGSVRVGVPLQLPQQATLALSSISPDGTIISISAGQQVVIWEQSQSQMVTGRIQAPDYFWTPRPGFNGQFVTPGVLHGTSRKTPPGGSTLHVATLADGQPAGPAIKLDGLLVDSCLCADHRSVAAATSKATTGFLGVFDVVSSAPVIPPIELPEVPISVAARPGHPEVAVLGDHGKLLVINIKDGTTRLDLFHDVWVGEYTISRVVWSPDGDTLLTVTPQSLLFVRDSQTGKLRFPVLQPVLQGGPCRAIAFSADSQLLATAVNGQNMVRVWNLTTGEKVGREMPHTGDSYGLFSVAFSPDGKRILTGHKDGNARLWDWITGQVVGTPMKHPDEVFDAQFTRDGRHIVTSVRHYPPQIWDVATGKPAAPVPQNVPAGGEAESLAVAGDRVVVTAGNQFTVLDVSSMRRKQADELPILQMRAELASNHKQQLGELVPLEHKEWLDRWEQLVVARQTPEQVTELLAQAFDEATDAPSRSIVIVGAARRGVLERLQAQRPESLQLAVALALQQSRQGRYRDFERLRLQVLSRLREITAKGTVEPSLIRNIVQLLTEDAPRGKWVTLQPTEMKGSKETTFTSQTQGFILAGIGNAGPDTFSIQGRAAVKRIAALRLDVAPLSSLPGGGSGYRSGNFHLTEVRARVRRADGTESALNFSCAAADFVRSIDSDTTQADGPWGVLDSTQTTRWDIAFEMQEPHWLLLIPDEPCDLGEDDALIVELDSGDTWASSRLGHFRLSVSEDVRSGLADELIAAVRKNDLNSDDLFAAACLINGEATTALNILQNTHQTNDRFRTLRAFLMATAQRQLGEIDIARKTINEVLSNVVWEPLPHSLTGFIRTTLQDIANLSFDDFVAIYESNEIKRELARLTELAEADPTDLASFESRAYSLMRIGRWLEAAEDWSAVRKLTPDARHRWFAEANCRLLAGDVNSYQQLCQDMIQHFRTTADAQVADSVTKTCLLHSGASVGADLPIRLIRDAFNDPTNIGVQPWFAGSSALASYREGKFDEALGWSMKHPNHKGPDGTLALIVRAMAEYRCGLHAESEQSLDNAESQIPKSLRQPTAPGNSHQRPAAAHEINPDWLTPELLRREAAQLIR